MNISVCIATQTVVIREVLTAARTYYVRTDGNDSNDGLTNTAGGAFLTLQHAVDIVCNTLDVNAYTVTIQVADGTYAAVQLKPYLGTAAPVLRGNTTTPANVIINTAGTTGCIRTANNAGVWAVEGFKLTSTGGSGMYVQSAQLAFKSMDFGACVRYHIECERSASAVATGSYAISGGGMGHVGSVAAGYVYVRNTVTLTGTPAFSVAFVYASHAGVAIFDNVTFSGAATGIRYIANMNAMISVWGGATLPGSVAGTLATGGQYE